MSTAPWEFVNNAVRGVDSLEGYAVFPTNRTISSNVGMLEVLKIMNSYEWSSVPDTLKATITRNVLRARPGARYNYVKNFKGDKPLKREEVVIVSLRLKCSNEEALMYIEEGLIPEKTLNKWKEEGFYK